VNPLLLPIELPIRVTSRVIDDARGLVRGLDGRLEAIQRQMALAVEMFGEVRRLVIDGVATIKTLDAHMQNVAANMRSVNETLVSIDHQTERLNEGLPTVQRGFQMLEPLEGTVVRIGRIVDRLPRWISGEPKDSTVMEPAPPMTRVPRAR
jgi:hypothetical protein